LVVSALHGLSLNDVGCFIFSPFMVFEVLSALIMMNCFLEGIFFGFVCLFRAFARLLGFSTGIFYLLF